MAALVAAVAESNTGSQRYTSTARAAYGAGAGAATASYDHDLVTYGPRRIVAPCVTVRKCEILTGDVHGVGVASGGHWVSW